MLEPVLAQIQQSIYQSVLEKLRAVLAGALSGGGVSSTGPLQPCASAFDDIIAAAAERHDVDQALLKAIVQAESSFSPTAVSRTGAKGLMQLMDGTARSLGVSDPFDPVENIDGGARFLRQLLDRYGDDPAIALAAYNAGPFAVERWGGLPPYSQTLAYVPRVLELAGKYREWMA
jgi:soluble lytic murein transglycosylase-like protein